MILTLAKGGTFYRVDDQGLVYAVLTLDGGRTYGWKATSQVEELTDEQRAELAAERARIDAIWDAAEAREQVFCPECGKPSTRDHRILLDGRVPFVCEDRHICVDETETPRLDDCGMTPIDTERVM